MHPGPAGATVARDALVTDPADSQGEAFPADQLWWARLAVCLPLIFLLGSASVFFAPAGSSVAAWWPPAGVAAALMLWTRRGLQPVVFVGLLLALGAANLVAGRDLVLSAAFGAVNAVEALVVAAVYGLGRTPPALRTGADFARLVLAAVVGAGTAGALAGASVAGLTDGQFWVSGRAVMASHGAAILLITPLFMVHGPRTWPVPRLEALVQPLALAGVVLVTFGPRDTLQLAFLYLPVLAWGAARFGVRVAAVQLLCVGVVASLLTARGRGPFAASGTGGEVAPEVVSALLQAQLVASALIALPLALLTTQLAQAAGRARGTAEVLEGLIESANRTAIIATDRASVVTYFNAGAENLLGWSAAEVVGRVTPAVWHDPGEIERRAVEVGLPHGLGVVGASVDDAALATPGSTSSEKRDWTWVTRSGEELVVSLRVSRRYDSTGSWVGWLGIGEDVSRDRAVADALQQALERERTASIRAAELERARIDFVASVSHELRTPLAVIQMCTELLLEEGYGPLPSDPRNAVQRVDRNAHRLSGLVEELLSFSSADTGSSPQEVHQIDLTALVARVTASMDSTATTSGVHLTHEEETRPVGVHGDGAQLERALRHLVSNAIKHTPPGGRVIVDTCPGPESAVIRVRDTGSGIAPEDLPHIFDRFYRSPSAVRSALPGMGLGLAIVHAIMTGHGGTVAVESEPGRGSTFTLTVPVKPAT